MTPSPYPTLAETIRRLGPVASISVQPFHDHLTGELWTVTVNHSNMGQGDTLEMAFADLANRLITEGKAA